MNRFEKMRNHYIKQEKNAVSLTRWLLEHMFIEPLDVTQNFAERIDSLHYAVGEKSELLVLLCGFYKGVKYHCGIYLFEEPDWDQNDAKDSAYAVNIVIESTDDLKWPYLTDKRVVHYNIGKIYK